MGSLTFVNLIPVFLVFILYFLACWPISMAAKYFEKRWKDA